VLEQATLRERFVELLQQQREALAVYESLADRSTDPVVRKQALQLRKEKERHVRLTERLIEIVD
jgi:rubrerythrin